MGASGRACVHSAASRRFLRQPGGSAEAVAELLGAGEVGLALELCPHVAGPLEEQRGLGGVAGGGGSSADALRYNQMLQIHVRFMMAPFFNRFLFIMFENKHL